MSRAVRIPLTVISSIAGVVVLLLVGALIVIQTGWFRNLVREKMIAAIEDSTGGRAEIGNFSFSPTELRAEVDNFVLHGTEGPGEPPLARVRSLVVVLKVLSVFKHKVDIQALAIAQPQVFVEVRPDGTTNVPSPKIASTANKNPLQTVIDLAVRHFTISDGLLHFADQKTPLDMRGENLRVQLAFDSNRARYGGGISVAPVYVRAANGAALPLSANVPLEIESDSVRIAGASFSTPESRLRLSADLENIESPHVSVRLDGSLGLTELARALDPPMASQIHNSPLLELRLVADAHQNQAQIVALQAQLGATSLRASGGIDDLKNMAGSIRFESNADLAELGRILRVESHPQGFAHLAGETKLAGANNYAITAKFDGRDLGMHSGTTRISGVNASSYIDYRAARLVLTGLRVEALGGTLDGAASVEQMDRFHADASLQGFNLRRLAAAYVSPKFTWDGTISGEVHASGRLKGEITRNTLASVKLAIAPGSQGQPVSASIDAAYNGPHNSIGLGNSYVVLPHSRLELSGTLGGQILTASGIGRARSNHEFGQIHVHLQSTNLNDFLPAIAFASSNPPQSLPLTLVKGSAVFEGTITGRVGDPQIAGHVSLENFVTNGQKIDSLSADANANRSSAQILDSRITQRKMQVQLAASLGLRNWEPQPGSPLTATATIRNAAIPQLAAMAGQSGLPLSGIMNAEMRASGTVGNPNVTLQVKVGNGSAYGEPFTSVQLNAAYAGQMAQLTSASVVLPAGRIDASASFQHARNDFTNGYARFHLSSSAIQIAKLQTVLARNPGLSGTVELHADGEGTISRLPSRAPFLPHILNASFGAHGLMLGGSRFGDLNATATTRGDNLQFYLASNLAQSQIHGSGTWVLSGDYPIKAQLAFAPVRLAAVRRLLSKPGEPTASPFDGEVDGNISVSGPVARPQELQAQLRLPVVQVVGTFPSGPATDAPPPAFTLRNAAPIALALDHRIVSIQSAHLTGTDTDFSLAGDIDLRGAKTLNISANGNVGLAVAKTLNPDIFASGSVKLKATIEGTAAQPQLAGMLELRNASFSMIGLPNDLSNANGAILFTGRQAIIQKLAGTSGGGQVTASGFVGFGGPEMDFRLEAAAHHVRMHSPEVSATVNASFDLAGTSKSSLLSGNVTVLDVALHSHSDLGNILNSTTTPATAPSSGTGLLDNMRIDVHVITSPAVQFRTTLAENLQASAQVEALGTPSRLGMLGRVDVTQGDILFFGNKYAINRGTISFYDPNRIDPVLDVSLETQAAGVDITLIVSGPMDALKLTYHSDPPLQFSELIRLLATGNVPTTDPVLAATQPVAPQQSVQQMGASAVLSQAVASPVAGSLQRLFGVTSLKIDPQIIGPENIPLARLTLQQQINPNLNFTYIQDLDTSNPETIRIEWAINPTWSAIATRDIYGVFGIDFYYKKRFR